MAALSPLVNGSGKTPLRIGSVQFRTEECPSTMPLGAGEQMISSTQVVGGGRITNNFGFNPYEVTWKGTFYTAGNVHAKVRALRIYNVTGIEVLLSWWYELYFCKVHKFTPLYNHENLSGYEITVLITRDANGAFTVSSATSIDSQVQALLAAANVTNARLAVSDPSGTTTVQQKVTDLNAVVQVMSPIASQITTAGPTIAASANSAAQAVADYADTLDPSSLDYADALALQGQVASIAANAVRGQSPQTTTVQGGSLLVTAAQAYGDVTQAFALKDVNGFPSIFLPASLQQSVKLPPLQLSAGQ